MINLRNQGYSLMELIVVMAIIGLMGLGTTTMITNMTNLSRRTSMKDNLMRVKDEIETNIKNDTAWLNTLCGGNVPGGCAGATINDLACLYELDNVMCAEQTVADLFIYNRLGEPVFNSGNAAAGWTLEGETCGSYGGDDNCPFRYTITATLDCPGTELVCLKPDVRIRAEATISAATPQSLANRIDVNQYLIEFTRDQEVRYEPLEVIHEVTTNGGAGQCADGSGTARPLNRIVYDVGANILSLAGNTVTLASGEYDCEVTATGFEAFDGFAIDLVAGGTAYAIGSGYSGQNSVTTVVGNADVSLNAPTGVQIVHYCSGPNSVNSDFDMGIPSQNYAEGNVFTRLSCIRNR